MGAAYCWGANFNRQFGNGSAQGSDVPVPAATGGALAGAPLSKIALGIYHACALTTTGVAYCWGYGEYGQLGDGNTSTTSAPVGVDTGGVLAGQTLTQIAANGNNTCAVSQAGAAYCWGDNHEGQLGDGSGAEGSDVPVPVDTSGVLAGIQLNQVAVGGEFACASDANGSAYCWGDNYYGELGDGSSTSSSVPVRVGAQPPTGVQATPGNGQATVSWTAPTVPGGSITGYTATASPGGGTCSTSGATSCIITRLTNGTTYQITVVAHTSLGDTAPSAAVSVTPEAGKSATTTSITSATASPVVGQAVTTQVRVAGPQTGVGTPTGVVTVSDGTQSCQASLSGSNGVAAGSCQLTEDSPGSYSLTASYPGDANFSASQTPAATSVTVGTASSSTVITSTTPSPAPGQPISTHVTVTGQFTGSGVPAPSGVVTVSDGIQSCQASLSGSNGVAGGSCDLTEAAAGSYSFTASYPGDADFTASQATPVPVTVTSGKTKTHTTTAVQLSAGSVVYGNETSLVVTVSVASQASGTPSGKVRITAGAAKLCVIRLSGGTGSCSPRSPTLLSPGKTSLRATYKGDASFRKSSAGARLKVRRAASQTNLTLSAASVAYGHEHSLKITVTVAPQYSGTPRGTVIIAVGQTTLCVVRLSHGMASCAPTRKALSPGQRLVVASYQGSANFTPSSAAKELTVTNS